MLQEKPVTPDIEIVQILNEYIKKLLVEKKILILLSTKKF